MKLADTPGWNKIALTPLGVDPELFSPGGFRERTNNFEVLCVGRLVPAKGQHILIDAVARLLTAGRRLHLVLVGDGPDRQSLEQDTHRRGINNHVIFEGAINQDRIRDLYRSADAFALASFAEGVPVVLMEAMAMEIPCISDLGSRHPRANPRFGRRIAGCSFRRRGACGSHRAINGRQRALRAVRSSRPSARY